VNVIDPCIAVFAILADPDDIKKGD